MRIEDVRAVLRPRSGWQAVDLGCLLWQRSLRSVLLAWFPSALVLAFVALGLAGGPNPWAVAIFWWTFPLASRGVLFVLSRSLFGDEPRGWRAVTAPGGFGFRGVLPALLGGRLSPQRASTWPVGLLEGLTGSAKSRRVSVLSRASSLGSGVAVLSLLFVLVQGASLLALLELFHDDLLSSDFSYDAIQEPWIVWWVWFLAVSLFEPLHVAIGFSIYLDGRSHVEGWDVELALRALAKRMAARPGAGLGSRAASAFGGVVVLALLALAPQEATGVDDGPESPSVVIERVLADPDFGETGSRLVPRLRWEPEDPGQEPLPLMELLSRLLLVAFFLVLAAGIALLVYVIVRRVREAQGLGKIAAEDRRPRSIVEAALEGGEAALPARLADEVRALFDSGASVEAAGLLYRAALVTLVERHRVPIEPSDTEAACVRRARRRIAEEHATAFRDVTHLWQRAAYAALELERVELDAALDGYAVLQSAERGDAA